MLGGYLNKFCKISNFIQFEKRQSDVERFAAGEKVLLGSSWYRTFVGYWIAGRQACWLAWVNLRLRSPPLFFLVGFCCYWLSWGKFFGENWIVVLVGPLLDPCVGNIATNLL